MGVTQGQAFQSDYINKDDCPLKAAIGKVEIELIAADESQKERKAVMQSRDFPLLPDGSHKRFIINKGNWITLEESYGLDSDMWLNKPVELFVDPSVMYGGKRVGGIRVRIPAGGQIAAPQPAADLLTWEQAKTACNQAGITYDDLVASLKANGRTGWNSARDTALVREMIAARAQAPEEAAFDAYVPPGDSIPF